ncbi:hypothetical protein FAIPA1_380012 [Frankia sp. AiPs1]
MSIGVATLQSPTLPGNNVRTRLGHLVLQKAARSVQLGGEVCTLCVYMATFGSYYLGLALVDSR